MIPRNRRAQIACARASSGNCTRQFDSFKACKWRGLNKSISVFLDACEQYQQQFYTPADVDGLKKTFFYIIS